MKYVDVATTLNGSQRENGYITTIDTSIRDRIFFLSPPSIYRTTSVMDSGAPSHMFGGSPSSVPLLVRILRLLVYSLNNQLPNSTVLFWK